MTTKSVQPIEAIDHIIRFGVPKKEGIGEKKIKMRKEELSWTQISQFQYISALLHKNPHLSFLKKKKKVKENTK